MNTAVLESTLHKQLGNCSFLANIKQTEVNQVVHWSVFTAAGQC